MKRRKRPVASQGLGKWVKRFAIAFTVLVALLVAYGTAIEPRLVLDERRYEADIPNLSEGWQGARIAVVADLQVGMWLGNTRMAEKAARRMVQARPAAILLGGDFLYGTGPAFDAELDRVVELLAPVTESGIPTFAVLGNHDHAVGAADALTEALEGNRIDVLTNEAVAVPPPRGRAGEPLFIVGIGSERFGLAKPSEALDEVPHEAPRVVLMHNPSSFPSLPPESAPLALAGHTHCGQIALPGLPRWSYLELNVEEEVVADGFAPPGYGAEGNRLFVTCGIGFSIIPLRINAPPQIAFFELTRPPAPG